MLTSKSIHTFHIPVMGLAYTIDSPIRVAHYGISSVISIIDDELMEKMNSYYSKKFSLPYKEISKKVQDYRAERITSYLNLVDSIVKKKFTEFKTELLESKLALENFLATLPNTSSIKEGLSNLMNERTGYKESLENFLEMYLKVGDIDVNIMTKVDKDNFTKNEQLPIEFNDAHASLRGFANSNLNSSVVLSAGMNPRLYSYFANFKDFFPDKNNQLKKRIILKVSDYRSAIIQGKFLAKKGLWVSEYRIESGLNCGGHAFATDGILLGPILEEFKIKKAELLQDTHDVFVKGLTQKGLTAPEQPLDLKLTVQGGVGTADEHKFLLENYLVDSVGWGSPFLLVPEATSVDTNTRTLLANAIEKDFYLSDISPLGIPFNTIKGTTNEYHKQKRIENNKAGSSCPKKYLALSKELGPEGICTASKKYQDIKLQELETQRLEISQDIYENKKNKINEKACLCVGLANASFLENNIKIKGQEQGVVICPGPNMAYFNTEVSLFKMMRHIYGSDSVLSNIYRPNMFIKELKMYIDYLKKEIETFSENVTNKQSKKWEVFKSNLFNGIVYYQNLFPTSGKEENVIIQKELKFYKEELITVSLPVLV